MKVAYLLVNFGGPRSLAEVEPFLKALLHDQDMIRSRLPAPIHRYLFSRVAKKRAKKIGEDYDSMGGGSPIYYDTEALREILADHLRSEVITFHRYLPETHKETFSALESLACDRIVVFPFFPQFSYATTGSCARLFANALSQKVLNKLFWVKSYPAHEAFVSLFQKNIRKFLNEKQLQEEQVALLFSAHGLPQEFIEEGDPYEQECRDGYEKICNAFPKVVARLGFQSQFGKGEWLKPSTEHLCKTIESWNEKRQNVIFIPLTFTSDHIETIVEVEREYMPLIRHADLTAYRMQAFNRSQDWVSSIKKIMSDYTPVTTHMLIRK